MNEVKLFNFNENQIKVLLVDNDPWFKLSEVCKYLEIGNPSEAKSRLEPEDMKVIKINDPLWAAFLTTLSGDEGRQTATKNGARMMTLINESGLYELIMASAKARRKDSAANKFRRWVTHDVLPTLRKTGRYDMRKDPTRRGGPADIFNPPRSPSGEVEIYSPFVTVADQEARFARFVESFAAQALTIMKRALADSKFAADMQTHMKLEMDKFFTDNTDSFERRVIDGVIPFLPTLVEEELRLNPPQAHYDLQKKLRLLSTRQKKANASSADRLLIMEESLNDCWEAVHEIQKERAKAKRARRKKQGKIIDFPITPKPQPHSHAKKKPTTTERSKPGKK